MRQHVRIGCAILGMVDLYDVQSAKERAALKGHKP
jgi:hypothetical protein